MEIDEIRIRKVPAETSGKIKVVSGQRGQTICEFLRPQIRGVVDSFPDELKQPREETDTAEIRISGISPSLSRDLENIAGNFGITTDQLLRIKMHEIAGGRSF